MDAGNQRCEGTPGHAHSFRFPATGVLSLGVLMSLPEVCCLLLRTLRSFAIKRLCIGVSMYLPGSTLFGCPLCSPPVPVLPAVSFVSNVPAESLLRLFSVDSVQEDTAEHYLSSLAILNSHFNYFKLKDVAFFILKCLSGKNPLISYTGSLPSCSASQPASQPS